MFPQKIKFRSKTFRTKTSFSVGRWDWVLGEGDLSRVGHSSLVTYNDTGPQVPYVPRGSVTPVPECASCPWEKEREQK